MKGLLERLTSVLSAIPYSVTALIGRIAIGLTFWNSGRTKVEGWNIFDVTSSAVFLFENEYRVPLVSPIVAAHLAALAEHVLPVFLWLGLATRYAALGLLAMTLVIQVFVYPQAYVVHGTWMAILLMLISYGPGKFAIDPMIKGVRL